MPCASYRQLETFECPEDYEEFKKAFFSKENRQYMDYVEGMEDKYGTKDFAKVLDKMSDKEYEHYTNLLRTNPIYNMPGVLTNSSQNGIMSNDAVSGARNPFSDEAKKHAEVYYGLARSMKTDVAKISKATGFSEDEVKKVKDFIFIEKHDLGESELQRFAPDYMMAESWQRLVLGKPEPHDITFIKHELMERDLIAQGLTQEWRT